MSQIVFINGASSAGKTSIGRALQDLTSEPFMLLGIDTCFAMVPPRWAGGPAGPLSHLGFAYRELPTDGCHLMLSITYGEVGWRMMTGFHRGVVEIVRSGNSVIIDGMLLDDRVRDDWLDLLTPWRPLLVGVFCISRRAVGRISSSPGGHPPVSRPYGPWSTCPVSVSERCEVRVCHDPAVPPIAGKTGGAATVR